MKRPVVDYRKLRFSNITSPQYRHVLLLLGWLRRKESRNET